MPNPCSHIVQTTHFIHKSTPYDVTVFYNPVDPWTYQVDVTSSGQPVVITYPNGLKATLGYSVSFAIRSDMARSLGIDALSHLTATAEADIRKLV